MRGLYIKNDNTLMNEITKKCKDNFLLTIGRMNIIKIPILPKAMYRISAIPIKISVVFLTEIEQS